MNEPEMVIAGAGEAGARAAAALREAGWTGPISLIGEENNLPYERPPLSKDVLVSEAEPAMSVILDQERLKTNNITYLANTRVVQIDREAKHVVLADGRSIPYFRLLLATGAQARRLQLNGAEGKNILYLRTFADSLALRSRLKPGAHLVIIGGGFIGLEVAASAIKKGCRVTILELAPRILTRGVPPEIAEIIVQWHRTAGVEFHLAAQLDSFESSGDSMTVKMKGGSPIQCDHILVGIGAIPETTLGAKCGLEIENGIKVDDTLQTNDPNIFAIGDCCSFPHRIFDNRRLRLEAWRNAQDQGTHVAKNMLGESVPYEKIPWFWTDQYDKTLQIAGVPDAGVLIVTRDVGEGSRIYFHLAADGRLVAACGIGTISRIAKDVRVAEMLIEKRAHSDHVALASPDVRLKTLLT